jgi:hypothetical protein
MLVKLLEFQEPSELIKFPENQESILNNPPKLNDHGIISLLISYFLLLITAFL